MSDGGLPNRGSVQFLDKGADGCAVRLTISYELPEVLRPIGEGVKPVVENILLTGAFLCFLLLLRDLFGNE